MTWEIWKRKSGEILVNFSTFWGKLIDDLQKSDCYGLNSERKQSLTSSHGSLACVLLLLAVFEPCWSIFSEQNRFSHIFPVPEGSPLLTVNLTVKLARLARVLTSFRSPSTGPIELSHEILNMGSLGSPASRLTLVKCLKESLVTF